MDLVVMIGNASMSRGKQVLQCCICMHITASVLLKILLRIEIGQVKQPICLMFAHCVSPTINTRVKFTFQCTVVQNIPHPNISPQFEEPFTMPPNACIHTEYISVSTSLPIAHIPKP